MMMLCVSKGNLGILNIKKDLFVKIWYEMVERYVVWVGLFFLIILFFL